MTKEMLDERIAYLEKQLQDVHGRPCEVYARIVGYYRPVRNWNAGKAEEYKQRRCFASV